MKPTELTPIDFSYQESRHDLRSRIVALELEKQELNAKLANQHELIRVRDETIAVMAEKLEQTCDIRTTLIELISRQTNNE